MHKTYISDCHHLHTFHSSSSTHSSFNHHHHHHYSSPSHSRPPHLSYIPMPNESFEHSASIPQLQQILHRVQSTPTSIKYRRPSPKPLPYHMFKHYDPAVVDLDQRPVKHDHNALLRLWTPIANFLTFFTTLITASDGDHHIDINNKWTKHFVAFYYLFNFRPRKIIKFICITDIILGCCVLLRIIMVPGFV